MVGEERKVEEGRKVVEGEVEEEWWSKGGVEREMEAGEW
jgi:hypothetical protein